MIVIEYTSLVYARVGKECLICANEVHLRLKSSAMVHRLLPNITTGCYPYSNTEEQELKQFMCKSCFIVPFFLLRQCLLLCVCEVVNIFNFKIFMLLKLGVKVFIENITFISRGFYIFLY